ncbi:hypothetical protein GEV33_015397 [Tenebrio molitor]|uniref:Beta-galactoside alpha-2,6-sialyltransferase 1 n=1 Tax=Tenebrio molitor TaxID=7067 RepID=A0A8J6H3A5_TENMO|nr:hypothetical protein GEV33_015397 [Tenebrio molitor]
MILRILLKSRPKFDIYEAIGQYFTKSSVDLKEEIYAYLEERQNILAVNSTIVIQKSKTASQDTSSVGYFRDEDEESEKLVQTEDMEEAEGTEELEDHIHNLGVRWEQAQKAKETAEELEKISLSSTGKLCQGILNDILENVFEESAVMQIFLLLNLSVLILTVSSFGGSEDKFLKKYAMMKIYESCFGPEVVKQIRKEMKAACAKCSALETSPSPPSTNPPNTNVPENPPQLPNFDADKLHQAILAYRPNSPPPTPFYRPYAPSAGMAPFYSLPYANPAYPTPMIYPGFPQQSSQFSPYGGFPLVSQPFYGNRMSRDMDIKAQLEALTSKMSGRVKNITCVMQELGYLDENLEPNYHKISERISTLPVSDELKRDMQEGVTFCQQFSQCVPDVKRDKSPLSRELIRPMFFFKCYKHKKLEACIMKDVREKYAGVTDEEFDNDVELRRTGKAVNQSKSEKEINELVSSIFPNLQGKDFELDTKKYSCLKNDTSGECRKKTAEFKEKLLKELRRVLEDEGNILKIGMENPYNVQYEGIKGNFNNKSPKQIMCALKKIKLKTLKRGDIEGGPHNLGDFLPKRNLFETRKFNSCAIVASAGALKDSSLGKTIDSHDLVLRFNHAPTKGFEEDVGRKTTIRVLNSQVVTRKEFKFLESDMYKNVTVVAWDPSNYKSTLDDWLEKPEFNLFPTYVEYKKRNDKARFFLINPQSLWDLWDFLQDNSPSRLRRNPLSSGFLGLGILLPVCNFIDIFEYVPSTRVTKRCHYYDPEDNSACTFGVWHPLAAEKLLTYHINTNDDQRVFQDGYVRIPGFKNFKC